MKYEFKFVPVDCSTGRPMLPVGVTAVPAFATVDLNAVDLVLRDTPQRVTVEPSIFAAMFAKSFCADVYYRRAYDAAERFEGQGVDEKWIRQPAIYETANV